MNIDLIIKLARLANENPNDNEANLAARKVCQLIKAAEYKFNITVRPESSGPKTWNDVRRSEEAQFRSKPPDKGVDFDPFDFLRQYAKQQGWDKAYEGEWYNPNTEYKKSGQRKIRIVAIDNATNTYVREDGIRISAAEYHQHPDLYYMDFRQEPKNYYYDPITGTNRRTSKPKRPLECTQCKQKIETAFVGVEATFVCHVCVWEKYMNQRP